MTLIEILLVLAIIGILLAILLPAAQSLRSAAKATVCLGNQRQIVQSCQSYATDHRGGLPATRISIGGYWSDLVAPYLQANETIPNSTYAGTPIRGCPEFVYNPSILTKNNYSYGINAYPRYGDGGTDASGTSVNSLHNRIGGTSRVDWFREFHHLRIEKPATRLYFADQDAFWTGSNQASWQSTGADIRHHGRMALTFFDGRSILGTAENYMTAQLSP